MFCLSSLTYLLTVAPTVSFWDCGEFIACANILGVPHPPGTPLFMIVGRAFILAFSFFEDIAYRMNLLSVFGSALGVGFTFLFTEKLLQLIHDNKLERWISFTGGLVAAALVNFSDTYWFNAVEAEVYGIAMGFVMVISWLSLVWVERRGTPAGGRILVMICYLCFLGIGFHLYTVMTIPAIFLLMWMVDPNTKSNVPLIVTGIGLLSVVYAVGNFIFIAAALMALWVVLYLLANNQVYKRRFALSGLFCLIALVGYSTHAYIPIRSAQNPRIDENNPETLEAFVGFVERKQYGAEGMLKRALHRRGNVLNQIFSHPHMGYGGYMLAQYLPWKVGYGTSRIADNRYKGRSEFAPDENEPLERFGMEFPTQMQWMPPYSGRNWQILLFVLFHVPMLWGALKAYKENRPFGAYMLVLYALASFGLIFYMNFSDGTRPDLQPYQQWLRSGADPSQPPPNVYMEVRERDYFFAPGYLFMSILFGISAAYSLRGLRRRLQGARRALRPAAVALVGVSVIVPAFSNYHEHNRSGMWVPYDYAYNLLNSCRPNGVLFTNGDNDTFPLWFMQEVERVRRDVRVVNLSLANTNWYIEQLLTLEPSLKLGFTPEQIRALEPRINSLNDPVDHRLGHTGLSVTLQPRTKKPYYKVQDILVMNIVQNNWPERPIHFAVTVSNPNMMGLEKYMVMEGMAYTLTGEIRNQALEPERTAYLVDSVYRYRGLESRDIFFNEDTKGLLSNYFATNYRLARWAQQQVESVQSEITGLKARGDTAGVDVAGTLDSLGRVREKHVAFGEKYIDKTGRLMRWDWRHYYFGSQFYRGIGKPGVAAGMLREGMELGHQRGSFYVQLAQLHTEQEQYDEAAEVLARAREEFPGDFQIAYALSETYDKSGRYMEAKELLTELLNADPANEYAGFLKQKIQDLDRKISRQSRFKPSLDTSVPADTTAAVLENVSDFLGVGGGDTGKQSDGE